MSAGITGKARGVMHPGEMFDGGWNLHATQIGPAEADAEVRRGGLQRQRDLIAGMQTNPGAGD